MQLVTQSATDIKQLIEYRLTDSATNTMKISSERISYKIAAGDSFDFLPLNNLGIVTTTGPTTLVAIAIVKRGCFYFCNVWNAFRA